jgi:hypothetical protein
VQGLLDSLADPSAPGVGGNLRAVAAMLSLSFGNTGRWLSSDLLQRVLAILRALPSSGASPAAAAEVCGGAAAVIGHLLEAAGEAGHLLEAAGEAGHLLEAAREAGHHQAYQLIDAVVSDSAACNALVAWGIIHPEAAARLPSGQAIHVPESAHLATTDINGQQQQQQQPGFWTPFMVCMHTMTAILGFLMRGPDAAAGGDGASSGAHSGISAHPQEAGRAGWDDEREQRRSLAGRLPSFMRQAVTPSVLRRVLQVAVECPCGEAPSRSSPTSHR